MPSRDLTWKLGVQDNASGKFGDVAEAGEKMSSRIGAGIGKLGDAIGGEVGELVSKFSEGFEKIGEAGQSNFKKIAVGGAVLTGLGVGMQLFASQGQAAEQQLKAAVDATGDSWEDYEGKFESAVSSQAKYGHDTSDVAGALAALTEATQNTDLAFKDLNVTADLAAAKHESLTEAGGQLAKVYAGSTKILKQFGIDMKVTAGNTDEANAAIEQLGTRLEGQASAQANTFEGHLKGIKTEIQDWGEKIAGVVGGPLTYLGAALEGTAGLLEIMKVRSQRAAAAQAELATANVGEGAAAEASVAGNEAAATSELELAAASDKATTAQRSGKLATLGAVAGIGAFTFGMYEAGNAISNYVERNNKFATAMDNAKQNTQSLTQALEADGGAFGAQTKQILLATLQSEGLIDRTQKAGISYDDLSKAITGTDDDFKNAASGWIKQNKLSGDTVIALDYLHQEYVKGKISADQYKSSQQQVTGAESDVAAQAKILGDAIKAASSATDVFSAALNTLTGDASSTEDALNQFKDSLDGVTDSVKSNGKSLDNNTTAGRKNEEALKSALAAAQKHAEAVAKETGSVDKATDAYAKDEAALRKSALAAGLNKTQVDALIKAYGGVKETIVTNIIIKDKAALASIDTLQGRLQYLQTLGTTNIGSYIANAQGVGFSGSATAADPGTRHASGGFLRADAWNVVGEGGAELIGPDGRVYPHGQSQQMIRGAGSSGGAVVNHFHVNVSTLVPSPDTGRLIAAELATWVKSHGGRIAIGAGITD